MMLCYPAMYGQNYLNTYHVKVQLLIISSFIQIHSHLNTYHVKVQLKKKRKAKELE